MKQYAPTSLDEVVFCDLQIERTIKAYASGRLQGNILLYGEAGNGKTSVARLIPKALGCDGSAGLLDINASMDTSINLIRATIDPFIRTAAVLSSSSLKFVLLDEVDRLSPQAQDALKGVIDFADDTMFILTTNRLGGVERALADRFDKFCFDHLDSSGMFKRAKAILDQEGIKLPDAQIDGLCQASKGSLRTMIREINKVVVFARG